MVGVGNMGGAVLSGVLDAGLVPAAEVGVVDLAPERRAEFAKRGCQVSEDLKSLANAKTTVLAVKPWLVDEVASGLGATQERVVSVMAGVPASTLHRAFGGGCRVVRTMPNTPCLLRQGVTGIAGGPGSSPEDVAYVAKMFRELGGVVEVDESFFGARRVKGKRGRGAYGKTIVFGIFERDGQVYTEIVSDCSRPTLQGIIRGRVDPSTVVNSDGWRGYNGLVDLGYGHFRVDHSRDEFARGSVHINGIEGFWGMAKVRLAKFKGVPKHTFHLHLKEPIQRVASRTAEGAAHLGCVDVELAGELVVGGVARKGVLICLRRCVGVADGYLD